MNLRGISIACTQVTLLTWAVQSVNIVTGGTGSAGAIVGLAIGGGTLAVWYASQGWAQSRQMKQWKARLLSGCSVTVYGVAMFISLNALGILIPAKVSFVTALLSLGIPPFSFGVLIHLAKDQLRYSPHRLVEQVLPQRIFSFPFLNPESPRVTEEEIYRFVLNNSLDRTEVLQLVHRNFSPNEASRIIGEINRINARQLILELLLSTQSAISEHLVNYLLTGNVSQNPSNHRPSNHLQFSSKMLHHFKEAHRTLTHEKYYTEEEINNMVGESFTALIRLGLYGLIQSSVLSHDGDIIFNGGNEPSFTMNSENNVLELLQQLVAIKKDLLLLPDENWHKILILRLAAKEWEQELSTMEQTEFYAEGVEKIKNLFNNISALKVEVEKRLMNNDGMEGASAIDWQSAFA